MSTQSLHTLETSHENLWGNKSVKQKKGGGGTFTFLIFLQDTNKNMAIIQN